MIESKAVPVMNNIRRSLSNNSQNSQSLVSKVPLQLRSTLQRKRSNVFPNATQIYQDIRNIFYSKEKCHICQLTIQKQPYSISKCQHKFCQACLVQYMVHKITSMQQISCPNDQCDQKLDTKCKIFQNLPQNYKQKYKKQQLWKQTISNPNLKICPLQKCKQGIIELNKIPPSCRKCKTQFCKQCMMKYHPQKPCDQNFKQNFKEWKRCPECRLFIQKIIGCNHIQCICKHQFCFVCLANWQATHYSCSQNQVTNIVQHTDHPKLVSILMILGFPLIVVLFLIMIVALTAILVPIGLIAGVFFSLSFIQSDNCICIIIILPITAVAGAIGLPVISFIFLWIPVISRQSSRYFRSIRALWNMNNNYIQG